MGNVVFEVGQVIVVDLYGDGVEAPLVVREVSAIGVVANDLRCGGVEVLLHPEEMTEKPKITSPTPKSQQHWKKPNGADVQILNRGGALAVECRRTGFTLCHSNVVDVARWLAERDYRCVDGQCVGCVEVENTGGAWGPHSCGAANLEITNGHVPDIRPMASLAFAVAEIWTAPTRETSRRYIDVAIAALRDRRFVGAIKATLVAFSSDRGDFGLRPVDIMAVIDACHTLEHNRRQLPFPNRKLTAAEVRWLIEPTHLAAYARISWARATVVAHLVADVYERTRAAC